MARQLRQEPEALVSVVMPVYNALEHVDEAVESILTQTHDAFELIVVDDGSDGECAEALGALGALDSRIRVLREPHAGLTHALNVGCHAANGKYIARLDSDDVALGDRLEHQVAFLERQSDVALVGGGAIFVNASGRPFAEVLYPAADPELSSALEHSNQFVHSAVMMRTDAFRALGGYRESFGRSEDYDLWLRFSERHGIANLERLVVSYRVHSGQSTLNMLDEQAAWSLIARASHRCRTDGYADPLDQGRSLSVDELMRDLHIEDDELTHSRINARVWYAKTLWRSGSSDDGRVWEEAERLAGSLPDGPRIAADVRATRVALRKERSMRRRLLTSLRRRR